MANIKHDIWKSKEGLTTLCFSGKIGKESRSIIEPDSELVHTFYADSHFDAMTKYYKYMDWGVYETEFEVDKLTYNLEEIEERARKWNEKQKD